MSTAKTKGQEAVESVKKVATRKKSDIEETV